MTEIDLPSRPTSRTGSLLPTTVVAVLAAAAVGLGGVTPAAPAEAPRATSSTSSTSGVVDPSGRTVVLRVPGGTATAALEDSAVADQLWAALPARITLRDPMGQAKSGRLPTVLDTAGAARTLDPETGGLYYWPPSGDLAVFYDDLGQTVPPPGLVRLGTVIDGLPVVASAGRRSTVTLVQG